jgi:MFS family permease
VSGSDRTKITYRYERWRALSTGIIEAASTTFLLLIAVRAYQSGAFWKSAIAAGSSLGLLFTPVVVSVVTRRRLPPARASSWLFCFGSGAFLVSAAFPYLPIFALASMLAVAAAASAIPLFTHVYQENYPEAQRGRLFSRTVMIRIAAAALFSQAAGWALSHYFNWFRLLLVFFAVALAFAGFCLAQIPSAPIHDDGGAHPFRAMRFVRDDKLFRRTLICWMFMGFANLMMLPLRVEYLANPKYNLGLSVGMIALLTGVIPNVARLVLSPIWGHLFDRMNFFTLRVTLNCGFAIGIFTFFVSNSFWGLVLGAIIFGISNAGGDVAWSLWVTKFAPPSRVADYMSVHTFLTGVRGVVAPMAAFYLAQRLSLGWLAGFSAALIVVATLLLVPEIKFGWRARKGEALVEKVSE